MPSQTHTNTNTSSGTRTFAQRRQHSRPCRTHCHTTLRPVSLSGATHVAYLNRQAARLFCVRAARIEQSTNVVFALPPLLAGFGAVRPST